jgi:hypothetical protein
VCRCGLHAFHEIESLGDGGGADVIGAVLAWGAIEVHNEGFRSQFQRPIVLAETVWHAGARAADTHRAARLYGAIVADEGDVETIAREHGDSIPLDSIPVQPLSLLAAPRGWDAWVWPYLAKAVTQGSVFAELDALPTHVGARHFRGLASRWIERALEHSASDSWNLEPPTTISFGQLHELTGTLPAPAWPKSAPRSSKHPLTGKQIVSLLPDLASVEPKSREITDALFRQLPQRVHSITRTRRNRDRLVRALYQSGSRAPSVIAAVIDAHDRCTTDVPELRAIANDPATASAQRADALERLAEVGSLRDALNFLAHPLADPAAARILLLRHGDKGLQAARVLAEAPELTDAQLSACLGALGSGAAALALRQLEQRPAPPSDLVDQIVKSIAPDQAALMIYRAIRNGEAYTNLGWILSIARLPAPLQLHAAGELLRSVGRLGSLKREAVLRAILDTPETSAFAPATRQLLHDALGRASNRPRPT